MFRARLCGAQAGGFWGQVRGWWSPAPELGRVELLEGERLRLWVGEGPPKELVLSSRWALSLEVWPREGAQAREAWVSVSASQGLVRLRWRVALPWSALPPGLPRLETDAPVMSAGDFRALWPALRDSLASHGEEAWGGVSFEAGSFGDAPSVEGEGGPGCVELGEGAPATQAAWSPDGSRIATSAGWDKETRLWSAQGEALGVLGERDGSAELPVWSPTGEWVLELGGSRPPKVWSAHSCARRFRLQGLASRVYSAAWSPDGRWIATAGWKPEGGPSDVAVWEAEGGALVHRWTAHSSAVLHLAWSPDSGRLASAGVGGVVRLWDVAAGEMLHALKGHKGPVGGLLWAHGGLSLLSCSNDRTIRFWGTEGGVCMHTFEGFAGPINAISLRPAKELLASACEDGRVRVWGLASRKLVWEARARAQDWDPAVADVAWSPSGHRLATAHRDAQVRIWDAAGALRVTLPHECRHVSWSSAGDKLLTHGHPKGGVRVWDVSRV